MGDDQAVRHVVREVPKATCTACGRTKPVWALERLDGAPVCKECLAREAAEKRRRLVVRLVELMAVLALIVAVLVGSASWFARRDAYELSPAYSMKELGGAVLVRNTFVVKRYHDDAAVLKNLQDALDGLAPTTDEEALKVSRWYKGAYLGAFASASGKLVSQTASSAIVSYSVASTDGSCTVVLRLERRTDKLGVIWRVEELTNAVEVVGAILGRTPQ